MVELCNRRHLGKPKPPYCQPVVPYRASPACLKYLTRNVPLGLRASKAIFSLRPLPNFRSNNSSKSDITCGVPQGSILGPLLFLIYINDIIESSSLLNFILFADDTNIFYSHKSIDTLIETLNHELIKVSSWFKCNKLSLNVDKTCFLNFSTSHSHSFLNKNIIIDNVPIIEKKVNQIFRRDPWL